MNNSEKLLELISDFIKNGVLTSQDAKKEILTSLKFKKDNLIDKLQLVSREEFEILKKIVQKQDEEINKLKNHSTRLKDVDSNMFETIEDEFNNVVVDSIEEILYPNLQLLLNKEPINLKEELNYIDNIISYNIYYDIYSCKQSDYDIMQENNDNSFLIILGVFGIIIILCCLCSKNNCEPKYSRMSNP